MPQPDQISILDQLQSRGNLLRLIIGIDLGLDDQPIGINVRVTVPTHDLLSGASGVDFCRRVQIDIAGTARICLCFVLNLDHGPVDDVTPGLDMVFGRVVRDETVAIGATEVVKIGFCAWGGPVVGLVGLVGKVDVEDREIECEREGY
jgi:hypothetical protein